MPIFEFKCHQCGHEFEALFMPSDTEAKCPLCNHAHGREERIEMSVSNFKIDMRNVSPL